MGFVVWLLVVAISGVSCSPTPVNLRRAMQLEQVAVDREVEDAQRDIFRYLLDPSKGTGVFFAPGDGLFPPRHKPQARDLELFDMLYRGEKQISALFDLFSTGFKTKLEGPKQNLISLEVFRRIRPILGLLPPLRLLQETKQQFHYYAGASEGLLSSAALKSSMNKLGMGQDAHYSDDLIRGITTDDESSCSSPPCIDRCDFVSATFKERGMMTQEQIEKADVLFNRILKDTRTDPASQEIEIDKWLDYPLGQSIFQFPNEMSLDPPPKFSIPVGSKVPASAPVLQAESKFGRANIVKALEILFDIVDDGAEDGDESTPVLNRCEHRILYSFSAPASGLDANGNIDEDLKLKVSDWTFETNGVAPWALEKFGARDLLGVTCRPGRKTRAGVESTKCSRFTTSGAQMFVHSAQMCEMRRLLSGLPDCNLPTVLSLATRDLTYKAKDGSEVKFQPLVKGLDSVFFINDDNGDLALSSSEFSDAIMTLTLFGEMAYASTPPKTQNSRSVHNLPYFHQWYIAKGPKYAQDLFERIASMGRSFRQSTSFKKFWKALHFPEVERIWDNYKSDTEGPLQIFDVQGMYNRLGLQSTVAKRVLREWHRPSLYCDMNDFSAEDRAAIASVLLSGSTTDTSPAKLMTQFCQEVLSKDSTCEKRGQTYACSVKAKTPADVQISLNSTGGDFESVDDGILTSIDLLDSVTFGIPAFNQRVAPDQFKYLFALLRGSNDNFDEVTPERWQIIAPILRTFSALDVDSSGFLSKAEFRNFGRCTSYAMPRFRLTDEHPSEVLFAKIQGISQVLKATDVLFKTKESPPADHIDLADFALVFSDLDSERCVRKYCSKAGDFNTMLPACKLMVQWRDNEGLEAFCRLNPAGKVPAQECKSFQETTEDQKRAIKTKAEALASISCTPAGTISFESFFEPQFSSETQGTLSKDRALACEAEIICQDELDKHGGDYYKKWTPKCGGMRR